MKFNKNTAKIHIISNVIQLYTNTNYSDPKDGTSQLVHTSNEFCFHSGFLGNSNPEIGSLIRLGSAPNTKFYLSWLIEIRNEFKHIGTEYLLESIEDGSQCWWSNVEISWMSKENLDRHPEWKWTDKQFEFKDRWFNAFSRCSKYMKVPTSPEFDGKKVTLGIRKKFESEILNKIQFDNFNKVKVKDMVEFIEKELPDNKRSAKSGKEVK